MDPQPAWNPDLNDYDDELYDWERALGDGLDTYEEAAPSALMGALVRTVNFAVYLETRDAGEVSQKISDIIDYMANNHRMDIANLLDWISWKDEATTRNKKIQYARTGLLHCDMLVSILLKWYRPPRQHNKGVNTAGASAPLEEVSCKIMDEVINAEMRKLAPIFSAPQQELSEDLLLSVKLGDLVRKVKLAAPRLWGRVEGACSTPLQRARNTYKSDDARILQCISIMCYSRSQNRCLIQKLNSVVLKGGGLSAKGNDTLHTWGITMSQKWIYDAFDKLGSAQRSKMKEMMILYAFFGSHDNLNVKRRKYELRLHNQSQFDSGTAGTIYIVKDMKMPDLDAYRKQRAVGAKDPIEALDIYDLEIESAPRIRMQHIYQIKKILLDTPAFDYFTYDSRGDGDLLAPPEPIMQLPTGPQTALTQFMLDTVHIEETSQDGNRKCIAEWLKQTELTGPNVKMEIALKKVIVWIGDQLTVCRIRGIKKDRCWDRNFVERFDEFVEMFGWFHAEISEEHTLHRQYYKPGSEGVGLKHAFELLKRKGLGAPSVAGNFHHHLQEGLHHVAEAHFRDLWCVVGGVDEVSKLRAKSPRELDAIATQIYEEYASTAAVVKLKALPRSEQDDVFLNAVLYCRDILNYVDLDDAIRTGDVGRMKDLLPRLFYRYNGGGAPKYAIEILELLQAILREWTPELLEFILKFCWLANTTGTAGGFSPIDLIQEHNIRDIKYIFAVWGPYATWEYLKKISACIPTLRKVKDHVENEFNHFHRGKSHTSPDKEADVAKLQAAYKTNTVHIRTRGRHLEAKDRVVDVMAIGSDPTKLEGCIKRWKEKRISEWSERECFDPAPSFHEDSQPAVSAPLEDQGVVSIDVDISQLTS